MNRLTVQLPKEQFSRIVTEAHHGDVIVLTDGERKLELETIPSLGGGLDLNLEEDTPELEAELLKAVQGTHSPFNERDLRDIADRARQEFHARDGK